MTIAIKPTASGSTIEQNGSTILTVDGSGNISAANNFTATGHVLQVVQSTLTGTVSTTSTSDVSSGLTASITPSSTSNKILIMVSGGKAYSGNTIVTNTVYRNGSSLGSVAKSSTIEGTANGASHSLTYLDSPSSISSVTYTIYYKSWSGNIGYFQDTSSNFGQTTLTLMEIAG